MKSTQLFLFCSTVVALSLVGCGHSENKPHGFTEAPQRKITADFPEWITASLPGGETTSTDAAHSSQAFSFPAANLSAEHATMHALGDKNFEQKFVQGPDSGHPEMEGLGPAFNSNSCIACHIKDGRGTLPAVPFNADSVVFGANTSLLLRISIEPAGSENLAKSAANNFGAPIPVPDFGRQLLHRGSYGLRADSETGSGQADIRMRFKLQTFQYPDGDIVESKIPVFEIENPYDSPRETRLTANPKSQVLQKDVRVSPRISVPMIGLGLLEVIDDKEILANVDAQRARGDEIHGHANFVYDVIKAQNHDPLPISIGRFGWKASSPNLTQQSLNALVDDMGVTSYFFPNENIKGTPLYLQAKNNGLIPHPPKNEYDADDLYAKSVVVYSQTLGVPERRGNVKPSTDDAEALAQFDAIVRGGQIFDQMKCAVCHTPSYVTGVSLEYPEFSNQKIYPFTDMLLHDMGDELADNRRDFEATGREWRTRPLWGVGLTQIVNSRAGFLHDGRARSLDEAILFHGGEAQKSRDEFVHLNRADRHAVVEFLKSL